MVRSKLASILPILRLILSALALAMMPLVWGSQGCGNGQSNGYQLFETGSQIWVPLVLGVLCVVGIFGARPGRGWAVLLHAIAFLGSLYLTLSAIVHYLFLQHTRWPAHVGTLAIFILFIDCLRSWSLSLAALSQSGSPLSPPARRAVPKAMLILGLTLLAIVWLFVSWGGRHRPPRDPESLSAAKVLPLEPPLALPFPATAPVELVAQRRAALLGPAPRLTEPTMWTGTRWQSEKGSGFGRHNPLAIYLLGGGDWLLVHASSGLWLVETRTLGRRARIRSGVVPAVDVSVDGSRLAYADCQDGDDKSNQPCELVTRSWPQLTELRRTTIKWPTQVRFAPGGSVVASSGGSAEGATVVPLDDERRPWRTQVLSSAVAAIPLSETRVAYLSDHGVLAIEELSNNELLFRSSGDAPIMDFPFRLGIARKSGEILFDATRDRLLQINYPGALVVEGVTGATPHRGEPLRQDELLAAGVLRLHRFTQDAPPQNLGFSRIPYDWTFTGIVDGLIGPERELLSISHDYVIRITHQGVARSVDFGPAESEVQRSLGAFDIVLWYADGQKTKLRRVALSAPAIDVTPEPIGELATHKASAPLLFASGDRAFLVVDDAHHCSLVRLPRGQLLGTPEPLPLGNFEPYAKATGAQDHYAMRDSAGLLLEIGPQNVRVLARDLTASDHPTWDAQAKCWSVGEGRQQRYLGDHCLPPPPLPPPSPTRKVPAAKRH